MYLIYRLRKMDVIVFFFNYSFLLIRLCSISQWLHSQRCPSNKACNRNNNLAYRPTSANRSTFNHNRTLHRCSSLLIRSSLMLNRCNNSHHSNICSPNNFRLRNSRHHSSSNHSNSLVGLARSQVVLTVRRTEEGSLTSSLNRCFNIS